MSAVAQQRGVGDTAANVHRDLTDVNCGDGGGYELCYLLEQTAGAHARLFLLVAAEPRASDNLSASQAMAG